MIFKRLINKKHKIAKLNAYRNGCKDTNIIRDKKDENLRNQYKYELNKKNKRIQALQEIIYKKDKYIDQVKKDLPVLKRQLEEIECFIEQERDLNNQEAGRKLIKVNETKRQIKKISKTANNITLNMLELTDNSNIEE